jgi:hypothetical protein
MRPSAALPLLQDGSTPLHEAVQYTGDCVVEELIEDGADLDRANKERPPPSTLQGKLRVADCVVAYSSPASRVTGWQLGGSWVAAGWQLGGSWVAAWLQLGGSLKALQCEPA